MLDDAAFGAVTPVKPKAISPADPAARLTGANGDRPFFAYSTNYLVDLDNAVIVDIEATAPIRQVEVDAVRDMLVRTRNRPVREVHNPRASPGSSAGCAGHHHRSQ